MGAAGGKPSPCPVDGLYSDTLGFMAAKARTLFLSLAAFCLPALANIPRASLVTEKPHLGIENFAMASRLGLAAANALIAPGLCGCLYDSGRRSRNTGKERDGETGLDYFGARYFSAAQGRWTSPDWSATPQPVPYADLSDPQTLNLYGYVHNNPLSRADADGHCCDVASVEQFAGQVSNFPLPGAKVVASVILGGVGAYVAVANAPALLDKAVAWQADQFRSGSIPQDMTGGHFGIAGDGGATHLFMQQDQSAQTRPQALGQAKDDAGIPKSQQPEKQQSVPITDSSGKQVVVDGKPQTSREYTHTTGTGEKVVIQDHSQGHAFSDGGSVVPHFNVRPQADTRHGTVQGTQPHYPYQKPERQQ